MVIHVIYKCVLVFLLYLVSCIDVGSGNVDPGKSFLMVVFPFWRVAGLVTGSPDIAPSLMAGQCSGPLPMFPHN